MHSMQIYPSILTQSLELAQKQLDLVSGNVATVQIDIIDGVYAPVKTITMQDIAELHPEKLTYDLHLQTADPVKHLDTWISSSQTRAIYGQIEQMPSQQQFLQRIHALDIKAGLSVDLLTPVSLIDMNALKHLDVLQIMSIYAGTQGDVFQDGTVEKIREARVLIDTHHLSCELIVDGGITPETWKQCKQAGADSASVGSFLWKAESIQTALSALHNADEQASSVVR
jgi:ribulose-phosphate 3-epimerase